MAVPRVAAPLNIAFPGQNAPLTAQPEAQPAAPWWQFWRNIWLRTGGTTGVDATALKQEADDTAALVAGIQSIALAFTAPQQQAVPVTVTPTGSPFTYQAPWDGMVVVFGGTVSAIGWSQDNSTFVSLPTSGAFGVRTGNFIKVTYTGVPTMTMVAL